ncbi:dihydrofolate reductase [Cucurbitaria berberidis CBS 394.84]|uniref:Dihydrofolate reductase n=1 Tax=Cucurbitaria berberidis CBS 394.84 TaxID=1168544 RepID=A0A9P4L515_9PLEO|nr:dihydrofolate reductase [Cucurbitaria berberidis CBS 394.84]KAF1841879.1 dihydrofolate reductase [Cucurbitaria berberidis CBS 394.84]
MAAAPPPNRPIKVLMLHGYTQSGPSFQAKTGALRKSLHKAFPKGIEFVYPTAPIRLTPADESWLAGTSADTNGTEGGNEQPQLDAWAWWRMKNQGNSYVYEGLELGLGLIASILKEQGPFDGVVGFSQGGACTAMVASLLEPGRREAFEARVASGGVPYPESFEDGKIHPPLKFAVSYSGFLAGKMAPGPQPYQAFYEPKIQTPMLHFIGTQDVVVEEAQTLALAKACASTEDKYIVYHPGGHFLPSTQKASVNALIGYIKEVLHNEEAGKKEEESVEDMDVPF